MYYIHIYSFFQYTIERNEIIKYKNVKISSKSITLTFEKLPSAIYAVR
jgi:uncharacterized protein (DUF2141 family)